MQNDKKNQTAAQAACEELGKAANLPSWITGNLAVILTEDEQKVLISGCFTKSDFIFIICKPQNQNLF